MYRYKQLISGKLSLRDYNAQVGEVMAGVAALNKISRLGMPVRQVTGRARAYLVQFLSKW